MEQFNATKRAPFLTTGLNNELLQDSNQLWSEPTVLFQVDDTGKIRTPVVISDAYGNVHVFWTVVSESQNDFDQIYYARLDATGWSTPVDIVAMGTARAESAMIGLDDYIHLIWSGVGGIYYSRAPIQGAEFIQNWSTPVLVATSNIHADIATSPSGNIYLAYPGVGNSGVFEQFLDPVTLDWSSPRAVALNSLINTSADFVRISISNNETIHVVWTEVYLPDAWPPRGIFYARSMDGGESWSSPIMMAGEGYDQINVTALDDNNIHVAWNGMAGIGGRYHRSSSDGGKTWSETTEVIPLGTGGTEGIPQLVADQSGILHMLTTFSSCAWYTYLNVQRWETPVCISGEKARASNYIEEPALALSEGNRLHAIFFDDEKRLWYSTKVTQARWIPPKKLNGELIQTVQSPIPTVFPTVTPTIDSTSLPTDLQLDSPSRFNFNAGQLLIFSVVPVLLLIIFVGLGFRSRTK